MIKNTIFFTIFITVLESNNTVVNENHAQAMLGLMPVRRISLRPSRLFKAPRVSSAMTRTRENRSHKNFTMMCRRLGFLVTTLLLVLAVVGGQRYDQGYDEYSQDNLYHDYAMKQQDKDAKP